MNEHLPRVSVIIAARPGQTKVLATDAARQFDYPKELLEIMIARGRQPSVQRNAAVREATGDFIYFLDDDSVADAGNLRRAVERFSKDSVQMVGGPNVCPADAPALEQLFAVVLSTWLAFGPSRARYSPVGVVRDTTEKELILCNLLVRRQAMVDAGGFNEALYPNEENALMDDLLKRGGRLLYDPELIVQRRPRSTMSAFVRMLMTYGRGRAEQFRVNPTPGSALNFVPPLFVLYLILLPALGWLAGSGLGSTALWLVLLPLGLYAVASLGQGLVSMGSHGFIRGLCSIPLVFCSHVFYGIGFWKGLFTRLQHERPPDSVEVQLEKVAIE